jgi:hypothetical protein
VFVGLRSSVTALAARDRFSRAGRRGSRRLVCGTLAIVARHLPPGTESRRAGWRRGPEIVRALVGTDGRPGRGLGRGPTVGQRLKGAGMVLDLHGPLARRRGPAATPVHVMTSPHLTSRVVDLGMLRGPLPRCRRLGPAAFVTGPYVIDASPCASPAGPVKGRLGPPARQFTSGEDIPMTGGRPAPPLPKTAMTRAYALVMWCRRGDLNP